MDTKSLKCVHLVEGGTNGPQYANMAPMGKTNLGRVTHARKRQETSFANLEAHGVGSSYVACDNCCSGVPKEIVPPGIVPIGNILVGNNLGVQTRTKGMVESLWLLVWSSVHCYKERYESDSTSSKQASSDPDFTSGMSTAGARLKKVMRRRFKMVDGVEYFEVHKGEWVRSDSAPVGPCKTCKGHRLIERYCTWNCPKLE